MIGNKIDAQMEDCGEFITVNGVLHKIIKEHQYDDFGHTLDTATLEGYGEIYSDDEGATWTDSPRGGEEWC